ncbi:MAG: hypothetical protein H6618_07685 [Deltaproteobacteria bacterium]|nr:hypothetical protein [Deltaproteobacteria bacterium]
MKQDDLYQQRSHFYLSLPKMGRIILFLCVAAGLLTFVAGLLLGEQTRSWGSLLFNFMFFFSISLGGVAFGGMQDIVGASWGRPVKRLHESFGAFLPWSGAVLALFILAVRMNLLGAGRVYSWVADPHMLDHFHGKNLWLNIDFMMVRDLVSLALIILLAGWHLKLTTGRDIAFAEGRRDEAKRLGLEVATKLRYWSAPVLVVYALAFTMLCFDLTMSLAPTWFSTLWGGWSFAILMQSLMALILIMMFCTKNTPLGAFYRRQQFHDIGKLLFGFTVFFAYLTYAHVLTYWYGNVPEETSYFITRLQSPWLYFVIVIPFLVFLFPLFALIPKVSKWQASLTIPICGVVLLAQWLVYMLVVMPEVVPASEWSFPWIELGIFCGCLGAFLLSVFRFAEKVPMLSLADPLLGESLTQH